MLSEFGMRALAMASASTAVSPPMRRNSSRMCGCELRPVPVRVDDGVLQAVVDLARLGLTVARHGILRDIASGGMILRCDIIWRRPVGAPSRVEEGTRDAGHPGHGRLSLRGRRPLGEAAAGAGVQRRRRRGGVDKQDRVYAFNRGQHPMVVFDRDGNFLRSWGEGVFTGRTACTWRPTTRCG